MSSNYDMIFTNLFCLVAILDLNFLLHLINGVILSPGAVENVLKSFKCLRVHEKLIEGLYLFFVEKMYEIC